MKDILNLLGFEYRFGYGAKIVLYILAASFPLFLFPLQVGVESGREIFFGALIMLAAIFWLLEVLLSGKLYYPHSLILYIAGAFLAAVFILSTIFSEAPWYSFVLADPTAERLTTLILSLILMFLAGSVFKTKQDVLGAALVLIFSGAVSALITLVDLVFGWSVYNLIVPVASGNGFNVVGTVNGLSIFYAMLLAVGMGLVTSSWLALTKMWLRIALAVSLALFFIDLMVINFRTSWILLLVSSIFLFGFVFRRTFYSLTVSSNADGKPAVETDRERKRLIDWRYCLALGLVACSVFMLFVRTPIFDGIVTPREVSPSFSATVKAGREVFKESVKGAILGSGPGTFGFDWSRYRSSAVNQSEFWGIRFSQGFSWISTLIPTVGILGALALVLFLLTLLFLFLRAIVFSPVEDAGLASSFFGGFAAAVVAAVFYPAVMTFTFFLFFSAGILSSLLTSSPVKRVGNSERKAEESKEANKPLWGCWLNSDIEGREVFFENQWAVFLSSLLTVFLISLGVGGIYYEVGKFREALWQQKGAKSFAVGSMDSALAAFERAATLSPKNFRNYQSLVELRTEKVRNLIQRAVSGENVQQEFQGTVAVAVQNSKVALELMPLEPMLWKAQGSLYEVMIPIPFVNGSEKFAFDSYKKATELDPVNPSLWVDWGRAGLSFADKLALLANQARGRDREEMLKVRTNTLQEAAASFRKSIELKADFAPAHFLLSQTAIRLGDLRSAVQATENAKITAPFDIGVAFQLGLLYYQAGDLDRAQSELERAVSINENYSNARYFLGLIYDRKGNKGAALSQFQKIITLNPGNKEVERILDNLRTGRGALESIVPPAEPPAERRELPVR